MAGSTRLALLPLLLLPLAAAQFSIASSNTTVEFHPFLPLVTLRHAGMGVTPLVTMSLDRVDEVDDEGAVVVEYDINMGSLARAVNWTVGTWARVGGGPNVDALERGLSFSLPLPPVRTVPTHSVCS